MAWNVACFALTVIGMLGSFYGLTFPILVLGLAVTLATRSARRRQMALSCLLGVILCWLPVLLGWHVR